MKPSNASSIFQKVSGNFINLMMLIFLWLLPSLIFAQFENKVSVNISGGVFKTFGKSDYRAPINAPEQNLPYLMPHYEKGYSFTGGA